MTVHTCPSYEAALQAAAIEHTLLGTLDMTTAHETSEDTLVAVWRDGVSKLMLPREREQFLALTQTEQRGYFNANSTFRFERFRDHFLESARRKEGILVH